MHCHNNKLARLLRQSGFKRRNMSREKCINMLIENEDFSSVQEYEDAKKERTSILINFLSWRAKGGTFKGEVTKKGYPKACKYLLLHL